MVRKLSLSQKKRKRYLTHLWYLKHKKKRLIDQRIWNRKNRKYKNKRARLWNKNNPDKAKNIKLKNRYGITLIQFNRMLKIQNNKCLICLASRKLVVDHDHKTGKVRGLVCVRCNVRLYVFDNNKLFKRFIKYIKGNLNGKSRA